MDGIKDEVERHGLPVPKMMVEPGRSMVANAGVTLYTVGTIKRLPGIRTYVAVDGGMSDNLRPMLYDARYEALIANRAGEAPDTTATVAGLHCESGDVLVRDARLAAVGEFVNVGEDVVRLVDTQAHPVLAAGAQGAGRVTGIAGPVICSAHGSPSATAGCHALAGRPWCSHQAWRTTYSNSCPAYSGW